jgi:hypothetical protein
MPEINEYIQEINATTGERRTIKGRTPEDKAKAEADQLPDYPMRFGGLDLAKRVDHSALEVLKLNYQEWRLEEEGFLKWPHVSYGKVADDTLKINLKMPMELLGFDRTGVGDAAAELFDKSMLPLVPIVTTNATKLDIIHIIRTLFDKKMLLVDGEGELKEQIEEQEEQVTDAGNIKYSHSGEHDDRFWALGYACYVALPYLVNVAPIVIKQGSDNMRDMGPRDINMEIDQLMGGGAQIYPI